MVNQAPIFTDFSEKEVRNQKRHIKARYRAKLQEQRDKTIESAVYKSMNKNEQNTYLKNMARINEEECQDELNQVDEQLRQHEQDERDHKEQRCVDLYNLYHPNSPVYTFYELPTGSSFPKSVEQLDQEQRERDHREQRRVDLYNLYHSNSPVHHVDDLPKGTSFPR